ncbi:MAG: nicotinate (nicotinamide) nucleotide adenylyltransferase [Pseudomonadota bacterium]
MTKSLSIGLLGGSFNPAHEGHLHISLEAIKRLKLDQVWWLVSPQNPLKSTSDMAGYESRFASAINISKNHNKIKISNFEKKHRLQYTHATLSELAKRHKNIKFVWIMGADNLASFHLWQKWRSIINIMPMVVFDRFPFSNTALRTKSATALKNKRLAENNISSIADKKNHWAYMFILSRRHPASSTEIRARL